MSKFKPKNRKSYNSDAINALIDRYGFSSQFIRQCIRGDRNSITADNIKKEYNMMVSPTAEKIKQFKNQTIL